ncbi:MAG TPA: alternative ribosome rescue aminoacyl-tRNA hydrolase ArfB [Candidatus Krumholzibacteria bacterium]|nr:alternative ribosome rescue aminoacyl-tRNA hydrolase ArfB [Candidatus Krumholzibacteria bacterium]
MGSAGLEKRGLRVGDDVVIPEAELEVRSSRSGGPGGQNVNKVETRIELRFDLEASALFDAATKQRLRARLGKRVTEDGVVRVVAQMHRSRARNEAEARARLVALLQRALTAPRPRRPTRPTRASKQRRLEAKRQRAASKRARRVEDD